MCRTTPDHPVHHYPRRTRSHHSHGVTKESQASWRGWVSHWQAVNVYFPSKSVCTFLLKLFVLPRQATENADIASSWGSPVDDGRAVSSGLQYDNRRLSSTPNSQGRASKVQRWMHGRLEGCGKCRSQIFNCTYWIKSLYCFLCSMWSSLYQRNIQQW
jgi:hypothetical protein